MTHKEHELRKVLRILDTITWWLELALLLSIAIAILFLALGFGFADIIKIILGLIFSGLFLLINKCIRSVNSATDFIVLEIEKSKIIVLDEAEVAKSQKKLKVQFIKRLEFFRL